MLIQQVSWYAVHGTKYVIISQRQPIKTSRRDVPFPGYAQYNKNLCDTIHGIYLFQTIMRPWLELHVPF